MRNEEKYRRNMRCLDKWMTNREKGKWIGDYFDTCQFQRVGIYGYGMLGKHLVRELRKKHFHISWVMDKTSSGDEACSSISRPDNINELENVDMVIITSLANVEEIEAFLLEHGMNKVISIEELTDSIYGWRNQN